MTQKLIELLSALKSYSPAEGIRSFMADVTGRKKWSPIHDRLHYALIEGNDGIKRWHLVHPDALHHLDKLGHDYTLHDQIGGEVRSGSEFLPHTVESFHANRVSSVLAEHPELGTFVIKGAEGHADLERGVSSGSKERMVTQRDSAPPRSLRWSEQPDPRNDDVELHLHTDLKPYEAQIRNQMRMAPISYDSDGKAYIKHKRSDKRPPSAPDMSQQLEWADEDDSMDFGRRAEWFTQAAMTSGAPVIPLYQGEIGSLSDAANEAGHISGHGDWYQRDYQYASFQPYVHPPQEAARAIGLPHLPAYAAQVTQKEKDWIDRLESRLTSAQDIASAPDCHGGNYVDVPAIMPEGRVVPVKHGIDYEWDADSNKSGILVGSGNMADEKINEAGHDFATKPEDSGTRDVVSTVQHWPLPSDYGFSDYLDDAQHEAAGIWEAAKKQAADPRNPTLLANAARLHKQLGDRDHSKSEIQD